MRPYQPKERLGETLGIGDVHLVSLDPAMEGLPNKFYGIAAAGRPTTSSAPRTEKSRASWKQTAALHGALMRRRIRILELAGDRNLCATLGGAGSLRVRA